MQKLLIAALMCAGAGAAQAGSIESFKASDSNRSSITEVGCPACAREAAAKAAAEAEIKLAPGEQIVEAREVDGQVMIYRTENLLGGSPVTMVRKASEADLIALGLSTPEDSEIAASDEAPDAGDETPVTAAISDEPAAADEAAEEPKLFEPVIANSAPGIDAETKTSALAENAAEPFDPSKFELRLN